MVQLHVGPQAFMVALQEVFGAPDADGAVVCAGGQIFTVTAEIQTRYITTVALRGRDGRDHQLISARTHTVRVTQLVFNF